MNSATTPTPGIPQTADSGVADSLAAPATPAPGVKPAAQPQPQRKTGDTDHDDEDWGVPPGSADAVRDEGALESLGEAVSAPVKGAAEADEERLRPKR